MLPFGATVKTEPGDLVIPSSTTSPVSTTETTSCASMITDFFANNGTNISVASSCFPNNVPSFSLYPFYSVYGNYNPDISTLTTVPNKQQSSVAADANRSSLPVNDPQNPLHSTCNNYVYPRIYFEALIDDAQIRYDIALEFFQNMRIYSTKCDIYISILQDLFVELAKPPPNLEPDVYRRLAKLRRCIRHLELKMALCRTRMTHKTSSSSPDPISVGAEVAEKVCKVPLATNVIANSEVKSAKLEPESNEQSPVEANTQEKLEKEICDLLSQEKELRRKRHKIEDELHSQFAPSIRHSVDTFPESIKGQPNCIFCSRHNGSHLCWAMATLEERKSFFQKNKMCSYCGKQHFKECKYIGRVVCEWPKCGAKGDHHSALCPFADYPITMAHVYAFRASQKRNAVPDWSYESVEQEVLQLKTRNHSFPPQDITIMNKKGETVVTSMLSPVLEDQTLELVCTAHGGRPAPRVLWWQNEILIDNQSEIILNNQVKNILHLERVRRHHHGSVLKCEAVNGGNRNSISKVVVVNLYLKPLAVRLLSDHRIFSAGKEYKIICETYGSRPPANITWWLKGAKIHSSLTNTVISADKNVTTSVLKYQPKYQHHGSKLTCKVTNNVIERSSILDSWNLHVQYAPIVKVELGRNLQKTTIKEGVDVYFDCIINANPPTKKIYWTHNGGILAAGTSRILINQTLVLQKITKQSNGNYCCIASNTEGESQSEPFYLNVQYEPSCSPNQQLVYGAIKHEKIEVVCNVDANPAVISFAWKFNNSRIQTKDLQNFTTSKTFSVASYQPKSELDYGTLLCWGKNNLGAQVIPCVFHIIPAGKPDTPHNCSMSSNTTERSVHVSCVSGFDGGLPQEFICEVLTNGSSQLKWNITNRRVPEFTINGLERDLDYTVFIYSSNGKGRSLNRVELQIQSVSETSEKHTRIIGVKRYFLFSLWTLALCTTLIILLGFLLVLVISIARIRKRHSREKHKKSSTGVGDVTPIHSDDDRNPDVIPQIEENHTLSRQTNSTNYLHLQPCQAEFTTYNTFSKPPLHFYNCTNVPVETDVSRCDSVVQWVQPRFTSRNNSHILISTVPSEHNSLIQHTCTQTPVLPHKESAV